ncbi:MAG: hypothetical protein ACXVAX_06145 [Pseudobdellovibrio sp.]
MKTALMTLAILASSLIATSGFAASNPAQAPVQAASFSFHYITAKYKNLVITRTAASKEEAFKLAAKDCFSKLTDNKYPGEEKGLEIIDICANPKL